MRPVTIEDDSTGAGSQPSLIDDTTNHQGSIDDPSSTPSTDPVTGPGGIEVEEEREFDLSEITGNPQELERFTFGEVDLSWEDEIPNTAALEIINLHGHISIRPSMHASKITVEARKSSASSPSSSVNVVIIRHTEGVVICSIYPDVSGQEPNTCAMNGQSNLHRSNSDVSVDYEISIPNNMLVYAYSRDGDIEIDNVRRGVDAHAVNGSIYITSEEVAMANTMNGDIDVSFNPAFASTYDLSSFGFMTQNGELTIKVPSDSSLSFYGHTTVGRVWTDFDFYAEGSSTVDGVLNGGEVEIYGMSQNGDVNLRRQ